jgi:phosphatidate cytidylyltransferase
VHDGNNADQAAATPAEGVRIIGAEEAQAALEGVRRPPANEQTSLDLPVEEHNEKTDDGPTWSASDTGDAPDAPVEPPPAEVPPLPHWTEPATGAVPAIFSDDTGEHSETEDLEAWAALSGSQPRFRAEGADWAEADFAPDEFDTDEEPLGALSEEGPVDEEAAFAEALDERRRRPARQRAQSARPAPKPRPTQPPEGDLAPPGPAAARDLPTAILTAAVIVVAALVCFELGRTATTVLAAFIVGLASLELANSLQRKGLRPAVPLVLLASFTMPLAAKHYGVAAYPIYFALIVIAAMLWFLWEVTPGRPLIGVAATAFAFAYVGGLGGFAGLLLAGRDGVGLILGVAICSIAYDVVGFFVGSQFGRSRIAPNISPNKTVAGTVGGMLAAIILGGLVAGAIAPWTHKHGLVLGLLVAVGAFLGDLSESMIKRDLGLKDFGSLLPGHGGIMDRFDGLLFCLPIAYYLALHWHYV